MRQSDPADKGQYISKEAQETARPYVYAVVALIMLGMVILSLNLR